MAKQMLVPRHVAEAKELNGEIESHKVLMRQTMEEHIRMCHNLGIKLLAIKENCRRGEYTPVLEEIGLEQKTAWRYMRLAEKNVEQVIAAGTGYQAQISDQSEPPADWDAETSKKEREQAAELKKFEKAQEEFDKRIKEQEEKEEKWKKARKKEAAEAEQAADLAAAEKIQRKNKEKEEERAQKEWEEKQKESAKNAKHDIEWALKFMGIPGARGIAPQTLLFIFRGLAQKYHPDKGGTEENMQALNEARQIIQESMYHD